MMYQSKKNEEVKSKVIKTDDKCKTVILEIVTGPEIGKKIKITESTFKRWWKKVDEPVALNDVLDLDMDKINTPYPEPKEKKYIPKPESVIKYENSKKKKYNENLPDFNNVVEELSSVCKKVNENSMYVMLNDKSTVWRKSGWIDVYATEDLGMKLAENGFESKPNKDKDRPFAIRISDIDFYNKFVEVLKNA